MPIDLRQITENLKCLCQTDISKARDFDYQTSIVNVSRKIGEYLKYYVYSSDHEKVIKDVSRKTQYHRPNIYFFAGISNQNFKNRQEIQNDDIVILLEPDPGLLSLFLAQNDCKSFFNNGKIHVFSHVDNAFHALKKYIHFSPEFYYTIDPLWSALNSELMNDIEKKLVSHKVNNLTIEKNYLRWLENGYANLETLRNKKHLMTSLGYFLNVPVLLVGAGPSLSKTLEVVKEVYNTEKCLIVAASTALRTLIPEGIIPHFTVIIEGEFQNHFEGVPDLNKINLVVSAHTHPKHLNYPFKNIIFESSIPSPIFHFYKKLDNSILDIPAQGNVISTAFVISLLWGCNPVMFTGMDLAHGKEGKYSRGLEKSGEHYDNKKYFKVHGRDGEVMEAPSSFMSDGELLEDSLKVLKSLDKHINVYNCSEGGRHIQGAENRSLSSLIDEFDLFKRNSIKPMVDLFIKSLPLFNSERFNTLASKKEESIKRLIKYLDSDSMVPDSFFSELSNHPEWMSDEIRKIKWINHLFEKGDLSEDNRRFFIEILENWILKK